MGIHSKKIALFLKEAHPSSKGGVDDILSSKDLFADGWMDSLLHISLLNYIEKDFGIKIPSLKISRKNFLTINAIEALIS